MSYHKTQPRNNHEWALDIIKSLEGHRISSQGKFQSFSELRSSCIKWKKLREMTYLKIICKWKALDKYTGILQCYYYYY